MNIENDVLETFIRSVKLIDEFDMEFDIKTLVSYKQQILTYLTTYKIKKKIAHILERLYDNVNNKIEEIFIHKKKRKHSYTYYPEYIDEFFNKKIYIKKEFNINKLEAYTEQAIQLRTSNQNFKITNTQAFIKTFISENTPYKGLLLWHGVGVGKTCGAISIAENFKNKDINILLPSNTLKQNWRDEILNIKKELNKKSKDSIVQCTGLTYTDKIDIDYWKKKIKREDQDKYDVDNLKLNKRINKLIGEHYSFSTYMTLANSIEKEFKYSKKVCKNSLRLDIQVCPLKDEYSLHKSRPLMYHEQIQYIKNRFSNKVFIMDEIHQTRSNGGISETEHKKIRPYLEMIARYADQTHFILLSATPMYNITDEIRWILNLLLWNDGRGPISDKLFDKSGLQLQTHPDDKDYYTNMLINKSRGYISHLRGENPFTFPIKLSPFISKKRDDDGMLPFLPTPKQYIQNSVLKDFPVAESDTGSDELDTYFQHIEKVKFLYPDEFGDWQYNIIQEKMLSTKILDLSNINLLTKYSNIIYPAINEDGDIDETSIGTSDEAMRMISNNKYEYMYDYPFMKISDTDEEDDEPTLLKKHSIKIYNIIKSIKNLLPIKQSSYTSGDILNNVEKPGGGIVFIYSKFKDFGVKAMAFALEELGFNRFILNKDADYMDDNMLIRTRDDTERFCAYNKKKYKYIADDQKHTFTQARYIYLDGSVPKPMLNHLVKESRGEGVSNRTNHYGENILAILGTRVVEVGLSFFNVRQIHILEPWFHFQAMAQVVGRGSRNFSHKHLDKEYRNLMVYLHVGTRPQPDEDDRVETIDERLYRDSYNKKKNMIKVELILKQNAVDCQLNINGNMFIENKATESEYYTTGSLQMKIHDSIREDSRVKFVGDEDYSMSCNLQNCREFKCYQVDSTDNIDMDTDTFTHVNNSENINQSKLLIKQLFTHKHYYELKDILKQVIDNISFFSHIKDTIEDKRLIVYSALDKIITDKEIIYYKKNPGYLIMRLVSEQGDHNEAAFYIFQPTIIDQTNAETYESIHSQSFKKEYIKINKKLMLATNEKLKNIYMLQQNNLFKKLFNKEDTTLPLTYRNSILGKHKRSYLSPLQNKKKNILPSKVSGSISSPAASATPVTSSTTFNDTDKEDYERILLTLQEKFILTELDSVNKLIESLHDNILVNTPDKKILFSEQLLIMRRYKGLDLLTLPNKRIVLKRHIREIILIDDVDDITLEDETKESDQNMYDSIEYIYKTYAPQNPILRSGNNILKLIKKHKQTEEDEDLYNVKLLMTLYLKYDPDAARLFMARLRETYVTTEYDSHFLKTFKDDIQTFFVSKKKKYMGTLYKNIFIQDMIMKLLILDYYDKNKNIYNNKGINYTIIRMKRDLYDRKGIVPTGTDAVSNEIMGFILRYSLTSKKEQLFVLNKKKFGKFGNTILTDIENKHLQYKEIPFKKQPLLGLSVFNSKKNKINFKLLDYKSTITQVTKGGKQNKKFILTGVVCGAGNIRMKKPKLQKDVESLLQTSLFISSKKTPYSSNPSISKAEFCELLSLLLRFKEYGTLFIPLATGTTDIKKYYYNYEQGLYLTF